MEGSSLLGGLLPLLPLLLLLLLLEREGVVCNARRGGMWCVGLVRRGWRVEVGRRGGCC